MKHCFLGRNVSIAFPEMKYKNVFYLENNQLKGLLGSIVNRYLELDKPNFCKIILVSSFGQKFSNNSYSGLLKLLKNVIFSFFQTFSLSLIIELNDFIAFCRYFQRMWW